MRQTRIKHFTRLAALGALAVGLAVPAHAQYNSDNPMFPGANVNFAIASLDTITLGGNTITDATFFGFDHSLAYSAIPAGTTPLTEDITFDATVNGVAETFTGTATLTITPESGVQSNGVGTYDTAITALSVSDGLQVIALGNGGATGQAIVSLNNSGPGAYHVNSFFDVFTELSLDGGVTYTQSSGANLFNDTAPAPTPEPITMGLGVAGLAIAFRRVRRSAK
ncbi:MAG TPA: hypothetical protein VKT78_07810 [Fimbriimonadaceae bacterium]|nr:hypothetical protein [Fimbriimonadaceae bacterium]